MTEQIARQMEVNLRELILGGKIQAGQIIVFGTSTSEVQGKKIGTGGAMEIAEQLYMAIAKVRREVHFYPAFQCCEHLNRALVIERELLQKSAGRNYTEVRAVPVARAGGSMAAYVFNQLTDPCLVESIQADAGIDIGDTLIGMHLKPVAVPLRPQPAYQTMGKAHVTMAYTRPKLIGGPRAVYDVETARQTHSEQEDC